MSDCHFTLVSNGRPYDVPPHVLARQQRDAALYEAQTARLRRWQTNTPVAELSEAFSMGVPNFGETWAGWHDLYQPVDQGWFPIAGGQYERRNGALWPWIRTEQDLDWMRSASRFVAGFNNGHAAGLLNGYISYVIGEGLDWKPVAVDGDGSDPRDAALIAAAEKELCDFSERTLWPELQGELLTGALVDGDAALWLFDLGDHLDVRKVFPEHIRQPAQRDEREWAFGVHTPPDDVENVLGYWVTHPDDPEGDYVEAKDMVFLPFPRPGGWTRGIRRGVPLFMGVIKEAADAAAKIDRNMGNGVAIRQAIAYMIQEAAGTMREDSAADASFKADAVITSPFGASRTMPVTKAQPGFVPRIPDGMAFVPPPGHPETDAAINVKDTLIRAMCAAVNAPAWLAGASGRDQGAYAAELVKDAPFVRTGTRMQKFVGARFLKVGRKVLEIGVRCGRLRPETLTRLRLTTDAPSMEAQDPKAKTDRDKVLVEMGVKSVQQVQQEEGVDTEKARQEQAEWKRWQAQLQPQQPAPVQESRATLWEDGKGFTGVKKDSLGRAMYYKDGQHIAAPSEEEKAKIEAAHTDDAGGDRRPLHDSLPNANAKLPPESRPKMEPHEADAVKTYAADDYKDLNAALRAGKEPAGDTHKHLQAVFDATPPLSKPVAVSRYVGPMKAADLQAFIGKLQPGATVTMPGYTSTSTKAENMAPDGEASVMFSIQARHGIDVRPYSKFPKEDEFLLNHNSRFRVAKVTPPAGRDEPYQVEMEQVYP